MHRDLHTLSSNRSRLFPVAASATWAAAVSAAVLAIGSPLHADGPVCVGEIACEYVATPCLPATGFQLKAINDAGLAVGRTTSITPQPCIWTAEAGMMTLPKPPGVSGGTAVAINNNNWILVNANGTPNFRGYVLIPSAPMEWSWIPIVPNSGTLGWSWVMDINESNQVVGYGSYGTETSYLHPYRGFKWSIETGRVDVPIGEWNASEFTGINEAGMICGRVANASVADPGVNGVRAVTLIDRSMIVIEPPTGFDRTSAVAVNDTGVVAVNTLNGSTGHQAGMLFDTVTQNAALIEPPSGFSRWWINDLNSVGVVGGSGDLDGWPVYTRAVIGCAGGAISLLERVSEVSGQSSVIQVRNDGSMLGVFHQGHHVVTPLAISSDFDCNGVVNGSDLGVMLSEWGEAGVADLTGDGIVDGADLGVLLSAWTR